ncbi:MAG: YihA family ribosome biogenesis GTP-binding protein [Deltaproteobacteria bacterium]|jgi:GTP-binding protein|nr:YihA family ribosome biogenesis GTP-binding protein [Deltaproteobacteria bacterium]MBW2537227.1 YihA family ribosome biogenesis GTP-binding protein [Deltaproteobacteria bacterium]
MSSSKAQRGGSWEIVAAEFVAAAHALPQLPEAGGPELAFAGRSNVGKSSLMNRALGRRRLVRTSSTPGCTRTVAFFSARARDGEEFSLVDLPGYGFAKRSKAERSAWAKLVEGYLLGRTALRAVVVLVDARHGPTDDDRRLIEFVMGRARAEPVVIPVATKLDKVPKSRRRSMLQKLERALAQPVIGASAVTGEGVAELWTALRRVVGG